MKYWLWILILVGQPLFAAQIYVDQTATGNNDGSSWADAFISVQDAVNAAAAGDDVYIAQGTYQEGAEITISQAINIFGGYPTGGGLQDIENNPTTLDGAQSHRVLKASHSSGTLFIEGITIQNGWIEERFAQGAGIHSNSSLILQQVMVIKNTTTAFHDFSSLAQGGGIYSGSGVLTLLNCQVNNNVASDINSDSGDTNAQGGGIYSNDGLTTLVNSQIKNNTALTFSDTGDAIAGGGGLFTLIGSITLINSQVSNNLVMTLSDSGYALNYGGGVSGSLNLQNSILWGNVAFEGGFDVTASEISGALSASYSVIKNQNPPGTGNLDATAAGFATTHFIDANNGNFGLTVDSDLIDAGDATNLPPDTHDVDDDGDTTETIPITFQGNQRVDGAAVDIGFYETDFTGKHYNTAASTYYFNHSNTAIIQDGLSWATSFDNLNDFFHIADKSQIEAINLTAGTFITSGTLVTDTAISITGGYDGQTLLPGEGISTIDVKQNNRVIHAKEDISLCNLKLINGYYNDISFNAFAVGGGVLPEKNLNMLNSEIKNNATFAYGAENSRAFGGGVYLFGNHHTFTNSQLSNNTVSSVAVNSDNGFFTDAQTGGSGIYATNTNMYLINSQVSKNRAYSHGFGPQAIARAHGGGIYAENSGLGLVNSLVSSNSAAADGAGGSVVSGGGISSFNTFSLRNSILWGNTTVEAGTVIDEEYDGPMAASHSLIKSEFPAGAGNIDATVVGFDPMFVDANGGDFRLLTASPLTDAGDFNFLPSDEFDIDGDGDFSERIPLDLDGYARAMGINVDIGPYEYGDLIFKDGF